MTWARHVGSTTFCSVLPATSGRVPTRCSGSWPIEDESAGLVERSDDPPKQERCATCAQAVKAQLEYERSTTYAWDLGELGGEA